MTGMSARAERVAPFLEDSPVGRVVREGLSRRPKRLPAWLFYDDAGSRLFEAITELPEYYPTRTERSILEREARRLVEAAAEGRRLTIVELGAGTATKSEIVVRAALRVQGLCAFVPTDVSAEPLRLAAGRLARTLPRAQVRPIAGRHETVFERIRSLPGRKLVLFLGSSIGNYEDEDARVLLSGLRASLAKGDALLLGTDLRKDPAVLLPAYDDSLGVTAAFNRNVLARMNRELRAGFDPSRFRHVALWNERRSRIEMHLESVGRQRVPIRDLAFSVELGDGERIHTESSVKYTMPDVDRLLLRSGFRRESTSTDAKGWFGVHLARST